MDSDTTYIYFDENKMASMGFTSHTIHELIAKFMPYIDSIEKEYYSFQRGTVEKSSISNLLHKLEGSLQYLALAGPIKYIEKIREALRTEECCEVYDLIKNLFEITRKTLAKLERHYPKII